MIRMPPNHEQSPDRAPGQVRDPVANPNAIQELIASEPVDSYVGIRPPLRAPLEGYADRIGRIWDEHRYEVETEVDGKRALIIVDARNRTQAGALARKAGYQVHSMNMIA